MRRLGIALAAMAAVLVMAAPAGAATWIVDDNGLDCLDANQVSIQAAVTAAAPGDNIKVCAGVYNEEVDITKPGLKLYSTPKRAAIIKAPPTIAASSDKAIVNIAADAVSLERFTITGPGPGPCDTLRYGVYVTDGNGVLVKDNRITRVQDTPFSGCQNGIGLRVGSQAAGFTADATVTDNLIDEYQKGGIVVDGAGTHALVQQNRTDGIGPTPITAQNGIQISRGATSEVLTNIVEDNTYTLAPTFGATGILLYQVSGGVLVKQNNAQRNDDNVGVYETTGTTIEQNDLVQSTFFDGLYMGSDTSGNLIRLNFMRNNAEHDCHDDTMDANVWDNNDGVTENRPGLCFPDGGDKPGRQTESNRRLGGPTILLP
jgi:nitrous oxidase accessory protein NosD